MLRSVDRRKYTEIAAFAFICILSLLFFLAESSSSANNDSQIKCSRTCSALNCDNMGIRYGKYCGVGHSGCPGEKPCDDLDSCCQIHDVCVEKHVPSLNQKRFQLQIRLSEMLFGTSKVFVSQYNRLRMECAELRKLLEGIKVIPYGRYDVGMTDVKCHEKFKKCVKKVQKSGKAGFSRDCPYELVAPTMTQGMDMAILMSQWANQKFEL